MESALLCESARSRCKPSYVIRFGSVVIHSLKGSLVKTVDQLLKVGLVGLAVLLILRCDIVGHYAEERTDSTSAGCALKALGGVAIAKAEGNGIKDQIVHLSILGSLCVLGLNCNLPLDCAKSDILRNCDRFAIIQKSPVNVLFLCLSDFCAVELFRAHSFSHTHD